MSRRLFLVALFGFVAAGCGPATPNASDPAVGRQTLQNALDAWKKGDTFDAYKLAAPAVTVVDRQWKDGAKLVGYEIAPDATPDGYDVQYQVKLDLKDAAGRPSAAKAVYNVSTTPALVIVRAAQ